MTALGPFDRPGLRRTLLGFLGALLLSSHARAAVSYEHYFTIAVASGGGGGNYWALRSTHSNSTDQSTVISGTPTTLGYFSFFSPGQVSNAQSNSLPSAFTAQGWRSDSPLVGVYPSSNWVLTMKCKNLGGASFLARYWARIWKDSSPDGGTATPLSPWTQGSSSLAFNGGNTVTDEIYFPLSSPTFDQEHYFVEVAVQWLTNGATVPLALVVNDNAHTRMDLGNPIRTKTPTPPFTPTRTPTRTRTAAPSVTRTATESATASVSPSATPSFSETPTGTETPTSTETPSVTETPTETETFTVTETFTESPSATRTPVDTATATPTQTPTVSVTPTPPPTPVPLLHGSLFTDHNAFDPSKGPLLLRGGLNSPAHLRVQVYDVSGRRISTVLEGDFPPGNWNGRWDGTDERGQAAAPGLYLLLLDDGAGTRIRKVALVRP